MGGVWVDIQYTSEGTKVDRAGHVRQVRQAQKRVVLTALAVWSDGNHEVLHYCYPATQLKLSQHRSNLGTFQEKT